MQKKYILMRGVVVAAGIYHVVLGLVLNGPVEWMTWIATNLLGATRMPDASALFLARMLGTYLLVFGVTMGLAAWDPVKNRAMLSLGAILVGLRAFQRFVQAGDLSQALGISSSANMMTLVALAIVAIALVLFRIQLCRDMRKGPPL